MSKSLKTFFSVLIIALCMPLAVASATEISKYLGLRKVPVPVIGTGSMYPSLFWEIGEGGPDNAENKVVEEYRTTPRMYRRYPGINILDKTFLRREITLGDMVTFASSNTREILAKEGKDTHSGFIKRVVALPGDEVLLRDGYLIRNGELVAEPYIYKPRSTYGGETLPDCTSLTVPEGSYFVLGDNRKTSADSRSELGFVRDEDISYLLPLEEQEIYHSLWRDTTKDQELEGTPTLVAEEFYQLANKVRQDAGLPSLTPRTLLARSASYKAEALIADNPDYPLSTALNKAGYHNILTSEFSIKGRYTAEELLTNILYFESTKEQLLDPEYSEIGIYDLNKEVDNCPTEVIVAHLGGYVPADYDQETMDSWYGLQSNLGEVIPSWEQALDNSNLNQDQLRELLTIFRRRLTLASDIITTMENSEWLSEAQKDRIKADEADSLRSQELAKQLNN